MNVDELAKRTQRATDGKLTAAQCHDLVAAIHGAVAATKSCLKSLDADRATAVVAGSVAAIVEIDRAIELTLAEHEVALDLRKPAADAERATAAREAPAIAKRAIALMSTALDRLEAANREQAAALAAAVELSHRIRAARSAAAAGGHEAPTLPEAIFDRLAGLIYRPASPGLDRAEVDARTALTGEYRAA